MYVLCFKKKISGQAPMSIRKHIKWDAVNKLYVINIKSVFPTLVQRSNKQSRMID